LVLSRFDYGSNSLAERSTLTRDKARRIAVNIAKLPRLLRKTDLISAAVVCQTLASNARQDSYSG
jgi:hypothetical protein